MALIFQLSGDVFPEMYDYVENTKINLYYVIS